MPLLGVLIATCGPVLIQEIAKTLRKRKKDANAERIAKLEKRLAELEAERK